MRTPKCFQFFLTLYLYRDHIIYYNIECASSTTKSYSIIYVPFIRFTQLLVFKKITIIIIELNVVNCYVCSSD